MKDKDKSDEAKNSQSGEVGEEPSLVEESLKEAEEAQQAEAVEAEEVEEAAPIDDDWPVVAETLVEGSEASDKVDEVEADEVEEDIPAAAATATADEEKEEEVEEAVEEEEAVEKEEAEESGEENANEDALEPVNEEAADEQAARIAQPKSARERVMQRTQMMERKRKVSFFTALITLGVLVFLIIVVVFTPQGTKFFKDLLKGRGPEVITGFQGVEAVTLFDQEEVPAIKERVKNFSKEYREWKILAGPRRYNWNLRANGVVDNVSSTDYTMLERVRLEKGPFTISFNCAIVASKPGGYVAIYLQQGAIGHVAIGISPRSDTDQHGKIFYRVNRNRIGVESKQIKAKVGTGRWYPVVLHVDENGAVLKVGEVEALTYSIGPDEVDKIMIGTKGARIYMRDIVVKEQIALEL